MANLIKGHSVSRHFGTKLAPVCTSLSGNSNIIPPRTSRRAPCQYSLAILIRDKDFVDVLATNLIQRREHVWVDRWELRVGDSLIDRIQSAIKTASALIIVLSKASVASEWCKKELSAGLIRELEERRVVVLPILLEDCDIPLFLRDKKYADFRKDFDAGLNDIHKAVASISSDTQGRIEKPDFNVDWGIAWGEGDGRYVLHLRFISHGEKIPYCVFTEVRIICNEALTQRFHDYRKKGVEWFGRLFVSSYFILRSKKRVMPTSL